MSSRNMQLSATIFINGQGRQRRFDKGKTLEDVKTWAHEQGAEALEVAHAPYQPHNYRFYVLNPQTGKYNRTGRPTIRAVVGRTQHLLAEANVKTKPAKQKRVHQAIYEIVSGLSPGPGESDDRDRRRGHPGYGPAVTRHVNSTSYPIGALR